MNTRQETKLRRLNDDMRLMLDWWINYTDTNPADIPYPNAEWMEYGCYTFDKEYPPTPDRIYDAQWYRFREDPEEHPHLKFDGMEQNSPFFVFREKVKPNSNWYELIEVASELHIRSRDWQHNGFNSIESHPQYDGMLRLWIDS